MSVILLSVEGFVAVGSPVRWQFLESKARQLAHEIGIPEPKVALLSGKPKLEEFWTTVFVDPNLIARFDEEEAVFSIAYGLMTRKDFHFDKKVQSFKPGLTFWDFTSFLVLLMLAFSLRALGLGMPWLCFVLPIVLVPLFWSKTSSQTQGRFLRTLEVTRNYDKASSSMRKTFEYVASAKGTKPLVGWRRLFAKLGFSMIVPKPKSGSSMTLPY